jgi:hypothetical protein
MKKVVSIVAVVLTLAFVGPSQTKTADQPAAQKADAGTSVDAQYEGGIYGSAGQSKGTIILDDSAERLIFYRKGDQREMFSIPWEDMAVIYPDTKVVMSHTGNVVSRVPLPGAGFAGLLHSHSRYLVITFDDRDIGITGTANFKFSDKKKLLAFINTLGTKARMKQKGDAYYRSNGTY